MKLAVVNKNRWSDPSVEEQSGGMSRASLPIVVPVLLVTGVVVASHWMIVSDFHGILSMVLINDLKLLKQSSHTTKSRQIVGAVALRDFY